MASKAKEVLKQRRAVHFAGKELREDIGQLRKSQLCPQVRQRDKARIVGLARIVIPIKLGCEVLPDLVLVGPGQTLVEVGSTENNNLHRNAKAKKLEIEPHSLTH